MTIFLSILASVGAICLLIRFFTFCFYRKKAYPAVLVLDLRGLSREETIDLFETVSTVSHTSAGKALIEKVLVRTDPYQDASFEEISLFLRVFELKGEILTD